MKNNLAFKIQDNEFILPEWDYLVDEVSKVFRLNQSEHERLNNSITAKLIAVLPFEAHCREAERTAIAHLCLYMAELQGFHRYCNHNKTDDSDIFRRLTFISTFEDGDEIVIKHGMNILALIMLENYRKSKDLDEKKNIYNPLVSGTWDYRKIKNQLIEEINQIHIPGLDWILPYIPFQNYW